MLTCLPSNPGGAARIECNKRVVSARRPQSLSSEPALTHQAAQIQPFEGLAGLRHVIIKDTHDLFHLAVAPGAVREQARDGEFVDRAG